MIVLMIVAGCASSGPAQTDDTEEGALHGPRKKDAGAAVDAAGAASDGSSDASLDPFDPGSCTGPILTDLASRFAPGAQTAPLGRYTLLYRERVCTTRTGCGAWTAPVDVKSVHQAGIYALVTWGAATEDGYVKGEGRAELRLDAYLGQDALDLTDDGARHDDGIVRHFLHDGTISHAHPYGTTRYWGDEPAGGKAELATAGGVRDNVWMPEHQNFTLAGEVREHCARLVASPPIASDHASYREVQVGTLLRY